MRVLIPVLSALLLTSTIACRKDEPPKPSSILEAAATGTAAPTAAAPSAMMATGHGNPAPAASGMAGLVTVSGGVLQTMDSGGYTYMRLKLASGSETWAAVNKSPVKAGETVTIVNAMQMDGFESKTLGRKFDHILFGQLQAPPPAGTAQQVAGAPPAGMPPQPAEAQAQMAAQHAHIAQAPDPGKIDVPKAEGADAKRIAEVFAQRAQLDGKAVTIRGKVVKFTPGVMGRNWMHIHDGSGSPEAKDNDLTVTTNDAAAVGDVVIVKGKIGVGRDFGMGYSYPVLLEEARVSK